MRSIKKIVTLGSWRSTLAVEYLASAHSPFLNPQCLKKGSDTCKFRIEGQRNYYAPLVSISFHIRE